MQYILVAENEAAKKFIIEMSRKGRPLGAVYDLNQKHFHHPQHTFKTIYVTGESGVRFIDRVIQTRPNKDEILSGLRVNQPIHRLVGRLLSEEQPVEL